MDFDFKPVDKPAKSVRQVPISVPAEKTEIPESEEFQTPQQISAVPDADVAVVPDEVRFAPPENDQKAPKKFNRLQNFKGHRKLVLRWPPGKKEIISAVVVVLFCTLGGFAILTHHTEKPVVAARKPTKPIKKSLPEPTIVASTLSGMPVKPEVNNQPVTGVMIENSQQARPQSGLSQAGVVFEAIAEGGITRFLALFQDTAPGDVGPIRSARPYFEQWALGFDAGYAHVGGSPEAIANIKTWGVKDLDQFYNSGAYHRIGSRPAPHNVYTGIAALNLFESQKGYATSKFTGFLRKAEAPVKTPTAKGINISISGPIYNVHYEYSPGGNSYLRSEGGAPHMDASSNTQITPKVVVALVMPYALQPDGYHSSYNTLGSGQAFVFQDGGVTIGTWTKPDNATQFSFRDAKGKPLKLNAGQTWLTAVGAAGSIIYTP